MSAGGCRTGSPPAARRRSGLIPNHPVHEVDPETGAEMQGMPAFTTLRLVKSEDLNHHQTLFAGRGAEWFVESGFIAASSVLDPETIVCVKIHGMHFRRPVSSGRTVRFTSRLVSAGRTSLMTHVVVDLPPGGELVLEGFISFVHVDAETKPQPHGLAVEASNAFEKDLQDRALELVEQSRKSREAAR